MPDRSHSGKVNLTTLIPEPEKQEEQSEFYCRQEKRWYRKQNTELWISNRAVRVFTLGIKVIPEVCHGQEIRSRTIGREVLLGVNFTGSDCRIVAVFPLKEYRFNRIDQMQLRTGTVLINSPDANEIKYQNDSNREKNETVFF